MQDFYLVFIERIQTVENHSLVSIVNKLYNKTSFSCLQFITVPKSTELNPLNMGEMEEAIPRSIMVSPTFTLKLAEPSPTHWAILTDADFIAHLEAEKARVAKATEAAAQEEKEAHTEEGGMSKGKKGAKSKSGSSGSGKATSSKTSGPAIRNKTRSKAQEAGTSSQGSRAESAVGKCLKEAKLLEGCEDGEDLMDGILPNPDSLLNQPLPESVWEAVQELLQSICSFQLKALHEMGGVRMVDWALGEGLMAEFSHVSLMVDEDLNISLQHHHNKILGATDLLERNIKRLLSPLLSHTHNMELEAELARFRRAASMNLLLPLALLDSTREDLMKFMNRRLKELSSWEESKKLIGALVTRLSGLQGCIWSVLENSKMSNPAVAHRVLARLIGTQLAVVNYHCGVLEGIVRRLGLAHLGKENLPRSVREGISRHYVDSLALILRAEEEANKGEALPSTFRAWWEVDGGLHPGYESDFISCRAGDVHPIFTAPLLPNLISEMDKLCLSEPAKPPPVSEGVLSPQELFQAIRHRHYDESQDLCHSLVGMANEFLNPPPLGDPPAFPVTSALINRGAPAPPPPPTVPTTSEAVSMFQGPPVIPNLPLSSSQVAVLERPTGSASTGLSTAAQYSFTNTGSQLACSTVVPQVPTTPMGPGTPTASGGMKRPAEPSSLGCPASKRSNLFIEGITVPSDPGKPMTIHLGQMAPAIPWGSMVAFPTPSLGGGIPPPLSTRQILGSAVIQHPSEVAGSVIVGSASSSEMASTGTSQTSVYLIQDSESQQSAPVKSERSISSSSG